MRRFHPPILLLFGLVAVMAVMLIAPAFGSFGWDTVNAAYSAESVCGGTVTYQVRFYSEVPVFRDPGLDILALTIPANQPGKSLQKYLVCDSSLDNDVWAIFLGTSLAYVPADSGQLVPRSWSDDQG